jgi:hypothetical protein
MISESHVETATLEWFKELEYTLLEGPAIAPDESPNFTSTLGYAPERKSYSEAILPQRLKDALARLNRGIPAAALEDAYRKIAITESPALFENNRMFQRYVVEGVLSLIIKDTCGGGKRVWKDGTARIEENIRDFFKSVLISAKAIREERTRREEQHRSWEAEWKRQEEEKQKLQNEKLRLQQLENQAIMWSKSEVLRSYIRQVEELVLKQAQTEVLQKRFEEWKQWAVSHADRLDPLHDRLPF